MVKVLDCESGYMGSIPINQPFWISEPITLNKVIGVIADDLWRIGGIQVDLVRQPVNQSKNKRFSSRLIL